MRGTPRETNKALSAPVLMLGGERSLVILACFFWAWVFVGVLPHWPMLIVAVCFGVSLSLLRFAAKRDSQGVAVFRANSRFLLQNRFYVARGWAGNVAKIVKVRTVPIKLMAGI